MLNVSGTTLTCVAVSFCSCLKNSLQCFLLSCVKSQQQLYCFDCRTPAEHSRGGGCPDRIPRCGGGRGGDPATQGEGRVSVLLHQPQRQHGV